MLSQTIRNNLFIYLFILKELFKLPSGKPISGEILLFLPFLPSLPVQLPPSFRPMCAHAEDGGAGLPDNGLESGLRLVMASNGDMACNLEFPCTEDLMG